MEPRSETGQPKRRPEEQPRQQHEPAESKSNKRPSPTAQKAEGKVEELKGRAKQAGGAITGDTGTKARGQVEEITGKLKQKIGDLRQKIRNKV